MTPQTPPTDRPLTAGDLALLREGDVVRHYAEGVNRVVAVEGKAIVTRHGARDYTQFTFVSRPATSAASERVDLEAMDHVAESLSAMGRVSDGNLIVSAAVEIAALRRAAALAAQPAGEGK